MLLTTGMTELGMDTSNRLRFAVGGLFPLDKRLRLDDGVLIGERVERGDEQAPRPGFDGHEAERGDGEAVIRLEVMQETALQPVAQDFVVDVQEYLRRQC